MGFRCKYDVQPDNLALQWCCAIDRVSPICAPELYVLQDQQCISSSLYYACSPSDLYHSLIPYTFCRRQQTWLQDRSPSRPRLCHKLIASRSMQTEWKVHWICDPAQSALRFSCQCQITTCQLVKIIESPTLTIVWVECHIYAVQWECIQLSATCTPRHIYYFGWEMFAHPLNPTLRHLHIHHTVFSSTSKHVLHIQYKLLPCLIVLLSLLRCCKVLCQPMGRAFQVPLQVGVVNVYDTKSLGIAICPAQITAITTIVLFLRPVLWSTCLWHVYPQHKLPSCTYLFRAQVWILGMLWFKGGLPLEVIQDRPSKISLQLDIAFLNRLHGLSQILLQVANKVQLKRLHTLVGMTSKSWHIYALLLYLMFKSCTSV